MRDATRTPPPVPPARAGAWGVIAASLVFAALALAGHAAPAQADLGKFGGHIDLGYGRLYIHPDSSGYRAAAGGSVSVSAGIDYPVARRLRLGADVGFHLLGTRNEESGSLTASIDYSAFEASLLAHWLPDRLGPIKRVTLGPAMMSARGVISAGAGGAEFSRFAVEEIVPALAASVTMLPGGDSPVKAGLELGVRNAWLPDPHGTWTIVLARLAIHY